MLFLILLFLLYFSQLFLISPGSVRVGSIGMVAANEIFAGQSSSSIICILLIAFCSLKFVFLKKIKGLQKNDVLVGHIVFAFLVFGITSGIYGVDSGLLNNLAYAIKLLMPFVFYYYMKYSFDFDRLESIYTAILIINVMLVGQVLICKFFTGEFSANKYYWYMMEEEFFGFYNSPHPFTGLLGLLSLWNIRCLIIKKKFKINTVLLLFNIVLMALSGVRSYLLGLAVSAILMYFLGFFNKRVNNLKSLALIIVVFVMAGIFIDIIIDYILSSRLGTLFDETKFSSGRDIRWLIDFNYFINSYDIAEKLFGRGFSSVYLLNAQLIVVEINSLNGVIDLLLDNGLIGTLLLIAAYGIVLRWCSPKNTAKIFFWGMLCYLSIGILINNILPYVTIMPLAIIFMVILKIEEKKELMSPLSVKGVSRICVRG